MHTFAIIGHATSAIAAFIIGCVFLFQKNTFRQQQLGGVFLGLLILMGLFLVVALLSHVTILPMIEQLIFGGLVILVGYMIWRAVQAVILLNKRWPEEQLKVIDHVGFVLISLFDGFAIVSALDLHASGWLIAVVAIGAVGVGVYGIHMRKKTLNVQIG